jgi:hypothetical protein
LETSKSKKVSLKINTENLYLALRKMFNATITKATYETSKLHGGTIGDVYLISGKATTDKNKVYQYKIVNKIQKKFKRKFDDMSWRREFDLYNSNFSKSFSDDFRWPECYYSQINENYIELWIEYIEGIKGLDLTIEMSKKAAYFIGRFQGKLYKEKHYLNELTNLSNIDFMKNVYLYYRSWSELYDYIRAENCEIPKHLCKMMIDIDENEKNIWQNINKLPIVLCHRDYWNMNIFYTNNKFRIIDWDTTGFGYLGEDIASLIIDETDINIIVSCYKECIPEYYRGFSEYTDTITIKDNCIYELILIMFGYKLIEGFKFSESDKEKNLLLNILQKIYEIGQLERK